MVPADAGAARDPTGGVSSSGSVAGAFFDVDGTLVDATIVHYYMYFRRRLMRPWRGRLWQFGYYLRCGYYLLLDRINRSRMNEVFYADYAGLRGDQVRALAEDCYRDVIAPHLYPEGAACLADHRRAGRRVVLVTGSLDFIIAPLARALGVDDVIAPGMVERDGVLTGRLDGPPVGERVKAERIRAYAEAHAVDLPASYAYGDSVADVPMLECVGNPCVVNPRGALRTIARSRGWSEHRWRRGAVGASVTVG